MTLAPERTQPPKAAKPRPSPAARRAGYLVTIVLNVVLLVIVNNLLVWGWVPILTDDFSRVLPIVNLSIGASIVANALYLVYDSLWFTGLSELVLLAISFAAGLSLYRVFPFDLSAYERDLAWIRYGQEVELVTDAYPGERFTGRIHFIDPVVDARTRTVGVRVNVNNESGKLKPDMFVNGIVH